MHVCVHVFVYAYYYSGSLSVKFSLQNDIAVLVIQSQYRLSRHTSNFNTIKKMDFFNHIDISL